MNLVNGLGVFALDAVGVVFFAAVSAVILAMCFSSINKTLTHGNDTNLDSLPAIGTGLVLGALIGGVVAFLQLASTSFTTTMLGYELIFAVLCFVVSKIVQKVKG